MSERSTVSVDEIANRLHFTRNHIYKAMLPYIKHEKAHNRIQVDEADLRQWLMKNASFSRQTKFVDWHDQAAWREYIAMLEHWGLDWDKHYIWRPSVCPPPAQRSKLPFRNVHPFDFWDEELVFPDDPRFNNAESFYRAMYESAAIKIKLGERKTIFCAPALNAVLKAKEYDKLDYEFPELAMADSDWESRLNYTDINSFTGKKESFHVNRPILYPAIDAEKEEEYYRMVEENHTPLVIRLEGKKECVEEVRETLLTSGIYTIEESRSASGNTLALTIPQTAIESWLYNMAKMKEITDEYEKRSEQRRAKREAAAALAELTAYEQESPDFEDE